MPGQAKNVPVGNRPDRGAGHQRNSEGIQGQTDSNGDNRNTIHDTNVNKRTAIRQTIPSDSV